MVLFMAAAQWTRQEHRPLLWHQVARRHGGAVCLSWRQSAKAMHVSHGPVRGPPHRDRDPALRPAAGVRLPLARPGHRPPVGGAKPQRAAANGNRADSSRSPGLG